MPDPRLDLRPIQVFLDTRRFIDLKEPQPFGGSKDFFLNNDLAFREHKAKLRGQIDGVAQSLRRRNLPAGFVKVRQRKEALAKSYRPLDHLFSRGNRFALVGADGVGELLFQATPSALERLNYIVEVRAEETQRSRENKKSGTIEPRVSGYRSELGGIDEIRLYGAPDRLAFSAEEAVNWMEQPNVIGGYLVELFKPDRSAGFDAVNQIIAQLKQGFQTIQGGMIIRPLLPSVSTSRFGNPSLTLSVQLTTNPNSRLIDLPFLPDGRPAEMAEAPLPTEMHGQRADLSIDRHRELLAFLSEQTLVRSIELPAVLETAPMDSERGPSSVSIPPPTQNVDYPIVAIVDGGIANSSILTPWKAGDAGLVPPNDRDESHGTFIAGLVIASSSLNQHLADHLEASGCKFYDLDLFPRRDLRNIYYQDMEELFDILDEKVKVAKRDFGARIFNLSFSIGHRSSRLAYSLSADRLDRIARTNDIIFVVSAGNLSSSESRPPWPEKSEDAATMLAGFGSHDQQITAPADHILGLTVGAINPPGLKDHVALMPTTYTRRGPGVGGARKPDLVHFGGADSTSITGTGLISLNPDGDAIHNCGTSFSSPLMASTIAVLDQRLGRVASRETLLALPVHRARRPDALNRPALRHVARDFVGFGLTPPADVILNDDPHSVTLVFSDRLLAKQRLEFTFAWPRSLVNETGSCRGRADLTLAFTPPIDPDHREESIRIQLEAYLHQEYLKNSETGEVEWQSRLTHDASEVPQGMNKTENYLIKTGLKWSPIKRYHAVMPNGRGNTSNWMLSLESLTRAAVNFPDDGVSFALLLTISDINQFAQVREEMRLDLQNRGLVLADITIAHRIRPRSG